MRSAAVLAFLTVILNLPCSAQFDKNTIVTRAQLTVYVQLSNDRPLAKGIQVQVFQNGNVLFGGSYTDDRGRAVFEQLPAGHYYIEVSGSGIEKTTGSDFEIVNMERSHTESVRVKPLAGANEAQTAAPGTAATVSAAQLKIPDKAQREFEKGVEAFGVGDNKKAEESFKKAIEDYPNYANAYSNLGVLYIKTGQQAKAKEAFEKSVAVDDKFAPGYINLARLSFADHKYPEAEATVGKALAIAPDNMDALAVLATCEYMNKENEKALATVRRIHTMPGHEAFSGMHLIAAQILMSENERDQAIDQYIAFLQESPNDLRVPAVRKTLAQMNASTK